MVKELEADHGTPEIKHRKNIIEENTTGLKQCHQHETERIKEKSLPQHHVRLNKISRIISKISPVVLK